VVDKNEEEKRNVSLS